MSPTHAIFLSYNRDDAPEAIRLRDWLRDEGLDVFMDNVHLVAGELWRDRLKQEVTQSHAFVVLMRRAGPRGFVVDEVIWALDACGQALTTHVPGPRIIPVFLDEVPEARALGKRVKELLTFNAVVWRPDQGIPSRLLGALRESLPIEHFAPQQCPFRGLATFDEADAEWFFGRKREIHEVIDSMGSSPASDGQVERDAPGHRRYLLISGDSGSGKSSLMRAGILPLLRAGALWRRTGIQQWRVIGPMRPGPRPMAELARALAAELACVSCPTMPLQGRASAADPSADLVRLLVQSQVPGQGYLLIVDQMEELLQSGVDETERSRFGAQLAAALQTPACPLYVIGTVRADAMSDLDMALPELVRARNRWGLVYALPRISESGLRLSIEEPARRAGVDVTEVADLILSEARNEPGALALVQHAMWSLWRMQHRIGPVTRLLRRDHEAAGGLAGMLSHDADAVLAEVKAQTASEAGALRLLCQLTWVGAEDRLFRRRLARSEADRLAGEGDPKRGAQVIYLLSGQGARADTPLGTNAETTSHLPLLVTGDDGATGPYVELVHEMLLRTSARAGGPAQPHWARLYDFIQRHLVELKLEQRLQADVQVWQQLGPWQRWRRLASFKEQRQYGRLSRPADAAIRRYLLLSRAKSSALVASLAMPLAYLGIGSYFVAERADILPIDYAVRLPLWALGVGDEPEFVRLPGDTATFDLGCDPARDTVGRQACGGGFLPLQAGFTRPIKCDMARHEVSFAQFDRFVFSARRAGVTTRDYPAQLEKVRGALPVMEVSRADAQAYADWLSSGRRHRYRLPLEWEWEYAARAGSTGPYPWGREASATLANHATSGANPAPRPVLSGEPNAFGLYNVIGNASEWVGDDADPADAGMPRYVWRGGSYNQSAGRVRLAARQTVESDLSGELGAPTNVGFRLCRER